MQQLSFDLNVETAPGYTIKEMPNGFTVTGVNRNPVTVLLFQNRISIGYVSPSFPKGIELSLNPFAYYYLSRQIAEGVMAFWEPPRPVKATGHNGEVIEFTPMWLEQWAIKQAATALGKRVHQQWRRLLAQMDPDALAASRGLFVAFFSRSHVPPPEYGIFV